MNTNQEVKISESDRRNIEQIVDVPQVNPRTGKKNWTVLNGSIPAERLFLIHHTPEANLEETLGLRGTVVDLDRGLIVRRTFGRESLMRVDKLPNYKPIKAQGGELVPFDKNCQLFPSLDGLLLIVFFYNGRIRIGSRRWIDLSVTRARFAGTRTPYWDLIDRLGGIAEEELFSDMGTAACSPHCHFFMLGAPEGAVASKMPADQWDIRYLGSERLWGVPEEGELPSGARDIFPKSPFSTANVDNVLRTPSNLVEPGEPRERGQYSKQTALTLEEANQFLKYGYYDPEELADVDDTQLPGEAVIIYHYDEFGRVVRISRVESTAYYRRKAVLHDTERVEMVSNPLLRFHEMMDSVLPRRNTNTLSGAGTGIAGLEYPPRQPHTVRELVEYQEIDYQALQDAVAEDVVLIHHGEVFALPEEADDAAEMDWTPSLYPLNALVVAQQIRSLVDSGVSEEEAIAGATESDPNSKTVQLGITVFQRQQKADLALQNLWINMLYAAPLPKQRDLFEVLTRYYEELRVLAWFLIWDPVDVDSLTRLGFPKLASFVRIAHEEGVIPKDKSTTDPTLVNLWVSGNAIKFSGKTLYEIARDAKRFYERSTTSTWIWLLKAMNTDALVSTADLKSWVTQVAKRMGYSDEESAQIAETFVTVSDGYRQVLNDAGEDQARAQIRWTDMQQTVSTTLTNSEILEYIFEKGLRKLAERYVDAVTPQLLSKLRQSNPDLYAEFTDIERDIDDVRAATNTLPTLARAQKPVGGLTKEQKAQRKRLLDELVNIFVEFAPERLSDIQEALY